MSVTAPILTSAELRRDVEEELSWDPAVTRPASATTSSSADPSPARTGCTPRSPGAAVIARPDTSTGVER